MCRARLRLPRAGSGHGGLALSCARRARSAACGAALAIDNFDLLNSVQQPSPDVIVLRRGDLSPTARDLEPAHLL